jgi:hypothetical protein
MKYLIRPIQDRMRPMKYRMHLIQHRMRPIRYRMRPIKHRTHAIQHRTHPKGGDIEGWGYPDAAVPSAAASSTVPFRSNFPQPVRMPERAVLSDFRSTAYISWR